MKKTALVFLYETSYFLCAYTFEGSSLFPLRAAEGNSLVIVII